MSNELLNSLLKKDADAKLPEYKESQGTVPTPPVAAILEIDEAGTVTEVRPELVKLENTIKELEEVRNGRKYGDIPTEDPYWEFEERHKHQYRVCKDLGLV